MTGNWLRRRSTLVWLLLASIAMPYIGNQMGWPPQLRIGGMEDGRSAGNLSKKFTGPPGRLSGVDGLVPDGGAGQSDIQRAPATNLPDPWHSATTIATKSRWLAEMPLTRFIDFPEILRFDITPAWVLDRWERVSTVVVDGSLDGMRVAVVTGTCPDDIAGSLTYFFDAHRKLQRITMIGHTGDYQRLGRFVQAQFHLDVEPSRHAALWVSRWNGRAKSVLLVRHAPVVTQANANARYEVWLELNLPNNGYRLSAPLAQLLGQGS